MASPADIVKSLVFQEACEAVIRDTGVTGVPLRPITGAEFLDNIRRNATGAAPADIPEDMWSDDPPEPSEP